MAEQFTKPGTANVSPADLKKLAPLMRHYAGMARPFTSCKRDQMKHGLSEDHANRRCAVLKDLIRGTTKWRNTKEAEDCPGSGADPMDVRELAEFRAWSSTRRTIAEGLLQTLTDRRASSASQSRAVDTALANLDDRGVLRESAHDERSMRSAVVRMLREQVDVMGALTENADALALELAEGDSDSGSEGKELEALVQKFTRRGMPRAAAEKAARRALGKKREEVKEAESKPAAKDGKAKKPPNLRQASGAARCGSCRYGKRGGTFCALYSYGVKPGQVCDSYSGSAKLDEAAEEPPAEAEQPAPERELWEADLSTAARKKAAGEGKALPDGSYPIRSPEELKKAVRAVGRGADGDKGLIQRRKRHIIKRAKALKATNLLPDGWNVQTQEAAEQPSPVERALQEAAEARRAAREAGDDTAFYRALARERLYRERAAR